jgi:hypothetical protein
MWNAASNRFCWRSYGFDAVEVRAGVARAFLDARTAALGDALGCGAPDPA